MLQEQSTLGTAVYVNGQPRVHGDWVFEDFARNWIGAIIAAGAKPVLYLTWARKANPEDQAALNFYIFDAAEDYRHALLAPVGLAWDLVRRDRSIELFQPDGSHPTLAGSYLAACAIYAAIFGKNPMDLPAPHDGVPRARALQEAAWRAYRESKNLKWWEEPPYPMADPSGREQVEMTSAKASGEWRGTLLFYPFGPAEMILRLKPEGSGWKSHLDLKFTSKDWKDESVEMVETTMLNNAILFTDPQSPPLENSSVHYSAFLTAAGELAGTASSEVDRQSLSPARFSGSFLSHRVQ